MDELQTKAEIDPKRQEFTKDRGPEQKSEEPQ